MADFSESLATYRQAIDEGMAEYFASSASHLGLQLGVYDKKALAMLQEFTARPGKRIRGALAIFAYETLSAKKSPGAIKLGIAIELIQNYLLIVDDVMDSSGSRRGKPTIHKLFQKEYETNEHTANMLAVNVGLIAQHMASYLLADMDEDPRHVAAAMKLFHSNIAATCYGQLDDLFNNIIEISHDELMHLYEYKNSYYTFVNPLQLGAVMAGQGSKEVLDRIIKIGLPAGVAFQLRDDMLGLLGDENATGKSNMDDVREGKRTLLMRYTMERASASEKKLINSALGNPALTARTHKQIQEIVAKTGAAKELEENTKELCANAKEQISKADFWDEQAKQFLSDLLDFVINRQA